MREERAAVAVAESGGESAEEQRAGLGTTVAAMGRDVGGAVEG